MLTTGEVAKLFQVSAQTVINWLDQGRMPFERIGRGPRRLTEQNVLNYIKEIGISHSALDQVIFNKTIKKIIDKQNGKDDAVAVLNSDLTIVGWNDAAESLTSIDKADAVGKPISNLISRVDNQNVGFDTLLAGEWSNSHLEASVLHSARDGRHINLHVTVSKYYARGAVAGYILVYRGD